MSDKKPGSYEEVVELSLELLEMSNMSSVNIVGSQLLKTASARLSWLAENFLKKKSIQGVKMSRMSKDEYYLSIAEVVSLRSTCLRRHYGVVIVNNDEIVSTGYNGNPRGMMNCCDIGICSKEDLNHNSSPDSYNICKSVHAEMNALMSAKRSDMIGAKLYIAGFDCGEHRWLSDPRPCPVCMRMIQNAGIKHVVNASGEVECTS